MPSNRATPNAIGGDCEIHPSVTISAGVIIGDRVSIGPNTVLTGPLQISDDCWIGANTTIGQPPEWIGKAHPRTWTEESPHRGVLIGARTVIRELTTVLQGVERPTIIGADCFVMNRCSLNHDVQIGDHCVVAAGTTFGGHITLGHTVNLGMNTVIHQRRTIGSGAMVGMGAVVTKDTPPYAKVFGNPAAVRGANTVGMSRAGLTEADIAAVAGPYAQGRLAETDNLPASFAEEFTWWRGLASRPMLS